MYIIYTHTHTTRVAKQVTSPGPGRFLVAFATPAAAEAA